MEMWEIIESLYGDLIITPIIFDEVVTKGKQAGKPDAFIIEKKINENKLKVHSREGSLPDFNLGPGETEIIEEALNEGVKALIDDKKARVISTQIGISTKNIPLVLIEGVLKNKISEDQFNSYFEKWILVSSPSQEQIIFIKQIFNLIKTEKE